MSAFLGPIHYWLYNKIQQQQDIIDDTYELGQANGLNLEGECNSRYGIFENKPLEEMIDHGNIHGWLQERVSQVEYKYAYCVTTLLERNSDAMEALKTILKKKGIDLAIVMKEFRLNAEGIYKTISDNLLDGMPCDHAIRVIKQSADEVIWTREACVHSQYWEEIGGDIRIYYELRDVWMEGLVHELGYSFDKVDDRTYSIKAVE